MQEQKEPAKGKDSNMKNPKNVSQGKRNRIRGAELQRQAVRTAKEFGLEAYNRDRGGAQHAKGDIEIEERSYGCNRRTRIAQWLKPEKNEDGVVIREDRGKPYIVLEYEKYIMLLSLLKEFKNG